MPRNLLFVIVLFFFLKLVCIIFLSGVRVWEDFEMAKNLYQLGELKYFHIGQWNYDYNFPVYPLALYGLFLITGISIKAALFFNIVIQLITAIYFYRLVIHFCNYFNVSKKSVQIAIWSTVLYSLHPLINFYAFANVHPFVTNQFFIVISLYYMFQFIHSPSLKLGICYSLVLGIGFIDRSSLVAFTIPFVILSFTRYNFRTAVKFISIVGIVSLIPVLILLARNVYAANHFALTSSVGENLWLGTLEETNGTTQLTSGKSYYELMNSDMRKISRLKPNEQQDYFFKSYSKKFTNSPVKILKMFIVKLSNFWFFRKNIGIDYSIKIKKFIPLYKVAYLTVLMLSIIATFMIGRKAFLLWSALLTLSIIQAMVYVETRHRIIIEPFLVVFAVIAVFSFINKFKKKSFQF